MADARVRADGLRLGALELGGTKALCAVGRRGAIEAEARIETSTPDETLARVVAFFEPHRRSLAALGVASFGPLELTPGPGHGRLLATPKPGWSGTAIADVLARRLALPVRIDTDVNAAALAEHTLGAAEGDDPCVYVTVGTGVGVGVWSGGRPMHGLLHPELGHLPAPALCDFPGTCPFHGRCLEGVASAPAIARRSGRPAHALADDDPVWALEARYLAHLLMACVLAYAPRRIVVGGGVLARSGLLEATRVELVALLNGYVPRPELTREGVVDYVRPARLANAGLVGALLLAEEVVRDADA